MSSKRLQASSLLGADGGHGLMQHGVSSVHSESGSLIVNRTGTHRASPIPGIASVLSFELFFALFIFAGLYKGDSRLEWVPIDLTVFFATLSLLWACGLTVRRRIRWSRSSVSAAYLSALFFVWMAASLMWSADPTYGIQKATSQIPLVLFSFLGSCLVIAPDPKRVGRFLRTVAMIAIWIAVESCLSYVRRIPGRSLALMSGDYIGVGNLIGVAWIIVYNGISSHRRTHWMTLVGIAAILLFSFTILILGSRQTLLAVFGVLLVSLFSPATIRTDGDSQRNDHRMPWAVSIAGMLFVATFIWLRKGVNMATLSRLGVMINDQGGGSSVQTRLFYFDLALKGWMSRLMIGQGLASFGVRYGIVPVLRAYPHNGFLEIAFEGGIVGLALLAVLIVHCLRAFRKQHISRFVVQRRTVLLVFLYGVFTMCVSGSYAEARSSFCFMGLLCLEKVSAEP